MRLDTPRIRSRLDLLYLVTREFGSRLDIDQVLQRVLSATVASVSAYDATLFLLNHKGGIENLFFIRDSSEVQQRDHPNKAAILERGLVAWIIKHQEDVLIRDTQADERWYKAESASEPAKTRSAISVPIQLPEQLIGVLTVTATQPDYFDEDDLAMLRIIADQAAFAIVNARLFKVEQHRHRLADTLASVARTINSSLDLKEVLYLILKQLALVIDYNSSSILLLEDEMLSVRAVRGFEDMDDALKVTIPLEEKRPNYQVVVQKKPILINDVDLEPNWAKSSSSQKVRSWIGAPLIAQDEVIGMLTVDSYEANKYTEENIYEVAAFADQAATAVANAQAVILLRSMEDSYTDLFEDSADMIIITTYQGMILDANRKACEMLRRPKEVIVGNDISFIDRHLRESLNENTNRLKTWREVSLELDILDAYREKVSLEINARRVRYGGKGCVQWVGRDISARKESERMRQDLINMLVHDLRGPVGNLINVIELLPMLITSIEENPKLNNFLTLARRSGQEVRDLVDSMLDVGRLEAGELSLQRSLVDLEETLQAVKDQVTPRAISKEMELTFNPLPADISELWIDRSMIRRILVNLVDNAIKYTPYQGQVSLTTTLNGETLRFAIQDNGPGISKANQARIFNKFSRVDHSANAPSGVGLGLAFCKLAAEAHGGSISVESEGIPGQGSTFYLTIPIIPPPRRMNLDLIAAYYDLLYGEVDEDWAMWQTLTTAAGGPILEVGCGTGRLLVPLAEAGRTMTGIDLSPVALAAAQAKIKAAGLSRQITLQPADMRDFDLPRQDFALAFIPLNTFLHCHTIDDQLSTLRAIHRHLLPEGQLIIDIFQPDPTLLAEADGRLYFEDEIIDPLTGRTVQWYWRHEIDLAEQMRHLTYVLDEIDHEGLVRRAQIPFSLRFIYRYEMELLLQTAGFAVETLYGSYDLEPFHGHSSKMIFVARKKSVVSSQ